MTHDEQRAERAEGAEAGAEQAGADATDGDGEGAGDAEDGGGGAGDVAPAGSSKTSRLEEEGDVAADYVEELLDIADLDGDIDIEVRDGRTYVSVIAEDGDDRLQDLVGKDGKGLEALQELVRLAVLAATGHRSRLILDIAGHRQRRDSDLREIAERAVAQVKGGEGAVHLDPMGAYERKIVHDVAAEAGLLSESEGEGSRRHVVISSDD
ncbi:MAG: R3H domain-containing nucleic acid-binding protein [Micrococcus sp.]|nr:R3H domain-containing nucleic acid-binding protein [Micrococcus sp.]